MYLDTEESGVFCIEAPTDVLLHFRVLPPIIPKDITDAASLILAWTRLQYHPLTFFKNHAIIPISCHRYHFYALSQKLYPTLHDDRTHRLAGMCWQMVDQAISMQLEVVFENAESSTHLKVYQERFLSLHAARDSWQFFNYTMIATELNKLCYNLIFQILSSIGILW